MKYLPFILVVCFSFVNITNSLRYLDVIVVLTVLESPEDSRFGQNVLNSWKLGETILPAAQMAANDVNNHSSILDDYEIRLTTTLVPDSYPNGGLVELVEELLSESRNIIGVIGVFNNKLANLIIPLVGRMELDLIQLVDPTALNLDSNILYPNTFSLYPSLAVHVKAASFLFQKLHWTKVGLIYSSTDYDPLYLRAAESFVAFIKLIDIDISVELLDVSLNSTANATLEMLKESGVLVFLVLLPQQESTKLICTIHQFDVEYTWVVVDNVFLNHGISWIDSQYRCENLSLSESLLVIRQFSQPYDLLYNELSLNFTTQNRTVVSDNIHSSILYDSVWALCLAVNASLGDLEKRNISFQSFGRGMNGYSEMVKQKLHNLNFQSSERSVITGEYPPEIKLDILHLQSDHLQQIGYFDSRNQTLSIDVSLLRIGHNTTYYNVFPPGLTAIVLMWMAFCYVLTTVILVLFILLRNEKEVKATSTSLSVCIFVGCYLILCGSLSYLIASGLPFTTEGGKLYRCTFDIYCFNIGIDLFMVTLLVKLLRIWRIFTLFGRTGKAWSDKSLLLFVGAVVLIKVVILITWNAVDIHKLQDVVTVVSSEGLNFILTISSQCVSQYSHIWLVLVYGYSVLIGIAVIVVSVFTRRIKRPNFKDTKKVNILISTIIFLGTISASLWAIFRLTGNIVASRLIAGIYFSFIPFLGGVFLFFPKILPPLLRKFNKTDVVHKKISTTDSSTASSSIWSSWRRSFH